MNGQVSKIAVALTFLINCNYVLRYQGATRPHAAMDEARVN